MVKVFIYHEYDLIEELSELLKDKTGNWETEVIRYRKEIGKMILILQKSTEVILKENEE